MKEGELLFKMGTLGEQRRGFHIVVPTNWTKGRLLCAIPEGSSLPGGRTEQKGDRLKLTLESVGPEFRTF